MDKDLLDVLTKEATAGSSSAASRLGNAYRVGEGVEKSDKTAMDWYIKAGLAGSADARVWMGVMMQQKRGIPENSEAVRTKLKGMSDNGDGAACCVYGIILRTGWGCEANYSEAIAYLSKGALEYHHAGCMNSLGVTYTHGLGVSKDDTVAVEWYRKAAEQGDASAQNNLGIMYEYGNGVLKDTTIAAGWYTKAAKQGYAPAQCNLGVMYVFGIGVEKDTVIAVEWYTKAAEQSFAPAQNNLGIMYQYGVGVEKDETRAFKWFLNAAEQGDKKAQLNVGQMYQRGEGISMDEVLGAKWLQQSAEQDVADAQFQMGGGL